MLILGIFNYQFMVYAFIVGLMLTIAAALVGSSIVLKRSAMLGDGLSHVAFGTFAAATILHLEPLTFSLPIVILTPILILKLSTCARLHGEALIAVISTSSLALGTFLISTTAGVNVDLNNYLFGSILSLSGSDVVICVLLSVFVVGLFIYAYHKIFSLTFDETFARSVGVKTELYGVIFAVICSLIVVLGMRLMGSLLISSLIIFPALSAMQIYKTYRAVIVAAVGVAVGCFMVGFVLSFYYQIPTSSSIVLINLLVFLGLNLVKMMKVVPRAKNSDIIAKKR